MSPTAKIARLALLRDAWERYAARRRARQSRRSAPDREKPSGAFLLEPMSEENLSTFADVTEPDLLSEIREAALC